MKDHYNRPGLTARLRQVALAAVLATGAVGTAHAQLGYVAANTVNTTGTYTDLAATGTAIATPNTDDANSAATPIGFTFNYNGTAFTDFVLNTNGFIKLGTTAPTGPSYTDSGTSTANGPITGADANLLLPFNQDLTAGTGTGGAEYRVATTGTTPNRVTTIQWKNVSDKARGAVLTQYANFSFQVKLYETSNQIEFVYGTATPGAASADTPKFGTVGLKGSTAAGSILGTKASATPWSGTVFAAGAYTGNGHNFRVTVLPDPGRTYRFAIQVANDAAAASIQGYASVIVPANNPFTLRGVVRNAGTNALTAATAVTLTISGANTYTQTQNVAALAVGASGVATFSGITLPNVGQNTVTLSVDNDGNNGNNSISQPMETSATTFSLATPGGASGSSVFNADGGYYAAKMTLSAARSITSVSALISDAGNQATAKTAVGESVYGVVLNATTGALLARSADYVITTADVNTFHTFTLIAPATVPAGDVLIGMAQTPSSGALPYFPFGVQLEDPNRPNTYFGGDIGGAAPAAALTATGQTGFKFPFGAVTSAPANSDLAVNEIQGYGSVAVPVGNPFSIRGVVRNAGIAAVNTPTVVTLTISGANTFSQTQTLPSLAVSSTAVVNFTNISLANVGANTVTVTVANDDNNANNSAVQAMATSATRFSYETPGASSGTSVFQATGTNNYYAAKITLNAARSISSVTALISDAGNQAGAAKTSVGERVYGVVINASTGALLGRTADYIIATADVNQFHTFTFSAPVIVPAGDVLIGMAQTPSSGTLPYYPFGVQNETPTRPSTFFTGSSLIAAAPTPTIITGVFKFPFGAETATPPTCFAPTAFAATGSTATSVSFSFTGVTGATGYQIVYGPRGFTPSATSTTSPTFTGTTYTLTGLTGATAYDFYVRTICSATDQSAPAGPVSATTACVAPTISSFPYSENFDVVATGQTLPCGVTVSDVNSDGFTWQARSSAVSPATANVARSAPNAMVYGFNSNDVTVGANDWFFTPALALSSTQRYRLSFYYRGPVGSAGNPYTNALEVKYGAAATPAGQTTTLFTNNSISNAGYLVANNTSTPVVADITPASGTFFVGFHATSFADQGFLAVDDVMITAGPLATSEALKRAVSVFPNPSATGVFNLEIHGANAKKALNVEVTNMLGQRVYTGMAKDNLRTAVDLSKLASGIYNIKVLNGEEYTMQQISIVK
ncbi:MAG TPA: T9SS type A sorting domain-containing protein [Hymenobacter sp.]|uniref:T9SS type A sorting domain-containing protein n=1 Tax=Hymenobacter sp. TaxID=1898978 RepID=UPI002ED9922C